MWRGSWGLLVYPQIHGLQGRVRLERYVARDHLAQGIQVAAVIHRSSKRLLRRHIPASAQGLTAYGHLGGVGG